MRKLTPVRIAAAIIAVSVFITIAAAFGESFHGLYVWASAHELTGSAAMAFPLIIDTFIITGEAALFLAGALHWDRRVRILGWSSVAGGLAVSVLFNTGRVHTTDWTTHFTDAIPPAAAAVALMIALAVLKRMKRSKAGKFETEKLITEPATEPAMTAPGQPEPASTGPVAIMSQPKASKVVKRRPESLSAKRSKAEQMIRERNGDISTNELAKTIGVSWATANKWREETPIVTMTVQEGMEL